MGQPRAERAAEDSKSARSAAERSEQRSGAPSGFARWGEETGLLVELGPASGQGALAELVAAVLERRRGRPAAEGAREVRRVGVAECQRDVGDLDAAILEQLARGAE